MSATGISNNDSPSCNPSYTSILSLSDRGVEKIFDTRYKIIIESKMKKNEGIGRENTHKDVNCSKNGKEAIDMCSIFVANA